MSVIKNPESLAELTFKTIVDNVHCYGENLTTQLAGNPINRQPACSTLHKCIVHHSSICRPLQSTTEEQRSAFPLQKMSVIKNPKSLVETTIKTIVENVLIYGENLTTQLGPELREMVLKKLLRDVRWGYRPKINKKAWLAFPSLLSRETKVLNTSALDRMFYWNEMSTHSRNDSRWELPLLEVLQHLAVRAPNLQELEIDHFIRRNCWLGHEEISSLSHLKNLSRLHITGPTILHSELKELVKNCRGLQFVEVYKLELDGEKKVDFFDDSFLYHEINFGTGDISIQLDKDLSRSKRNLVGPGPHYCLFGRPSSVEDLEFLETQKHATDLTMYCFEFENELEVVRFPRLPKLRSASFGCSGFQTHAMECFLEENGSHLSRLTVYGGKTGPSTIKSGLTLEKIFGWCSNLRSFTLEYLSLSSYNVPIGCLSKLKWFKCLNGSGMRVDISSLLSAPQLEGFEIKVRNLDLGDKETLYSRIAQKEILTNLKRYNIYTYDETKNCMTRVK